jgi:signal peptidase II
MNRWLIAIIVFVLLLDRATKLYIQNNYSPYDSTEVISGVFNIVHAENPGAAFSMLADAPLIVRRAVLIGFSGAVMAVVAFLLFLTKRQETPLARVALALVLGGAVGNFYDRVVIGTVTDFLQIFIGPYEYPSFNVADSAIFCGAVLLLYEIWRTRKSVPA